jgi:hypothetical protein
VYLTWEREQMLTEFWYENLKSIYRLEDLGMNVRIILKHILNRMRWFRLDSSGTGRGYVSGCCEDGSEPLGSENFWKFPD